MELFELGIVLRWNPAISGVLPRPPPPSSQIPAGTGVLYRHSSSNHHHFHPKVPGFNPFPSGSQLHSQCCPCPRRRLQHLEQGTSLNSNIPQGKSTRAPPALCTTQKLIFTAPLKPQSAKPCTSLGQGQTQGTNTSPAPLQSPLGHPNTSQRAVKGATATQPAQGWGKKINIHLGISETGNAGNAVMEFMGKYPGFCSLVLTTAGQAFSCLNITARTSG